MYRRAKQSGNVRTLSRCSRRKGAQVRRTCSRGMSPGVRKSRATLGMPRAAPHSEASLSFRAAAERAARRMKPLRRPSSPRPGVGCGCDCCSDPVGERPEGRLPLSRTTLPCSSSLFAQGPCERRLARQPALLSNSYEAWVLEGQPLTRCPRVQPR